MMHPHTELRFINDQIGYGVFATRRLPRGTITWALCELDRIYRPGETHFLRPSTLAILDRYAYADPDANTILCWDHARYLNHHCEPNTRGLGHDLDFAVRDIEAGEQITCEYGVLNIVDSMPCQCGAARCRGTVHHDDVIRYGAEWDAIVQEAFPLVPKVEQPLIPFIRNRQSIEAMLAGREPVPPFRSAYVPAERLEFGQIPAGGMVQPNTRIKIEAAGM